MGTTKKFKQPITQDILQIVKEGFEEQKHVKILSLYVDEGIIKGIYILPPYQSLSFYYEPLLDMVTDIDGHMIIIEELGQVLLYAYNLGNIEYFYKLIHPSDINIPFKQYDRLLNICIDNPPLQRIDSFLIEWVNASDTINEMRVNSFNHFCNWYNLLDNIDLDYNLSINKNDNVYIQEQFNELNKQINQKEHKKISELTIHEINKIYVDMQISLYITDNK